MSDELREAIKGLARTPSGVPDVELAWASTRRRTRRLRLAGTTAALVALVAFGPGLADLFAPPTVPIVAPVTSTAAPAGAAELHDGALRRWRIDGYGVELLVPADWMRQHQDPTTWFGDGGSLTVFAGLAPFGTSIDASVRTHCEEEAAHRPGPFGRAEVLMTSADGEPACLVVSEDGTSFVAAVVFPAAPNVAGRYSHLVIVGHGLDGAPILDSLRFSD